MTRVEVSMSIRRGETTSLMVLDQGRLTQLIALTGSAGAWRKTVIDKVVACVHVHTSRPAPELTKLQLVGEG